MWAVVGEGGRDSGQREVDDLLGTTGRVMGPEQASS